jgi:hypothetical protein
MYHRRTGWNVRLTSSWCPGALINIPNCLNGRHCVREETFFAHFRIHTLFQLVLHGVTTRWTVFFTKHGVWSWQVKVLYFCFTKSIHFFPSLDGPFPLGTREGKRCPCALRYNQQPRKMFQFCHFPLVLMTFPLACLNINDSSAYFIQKYKDTGPKSCFLKHR